MVEILTRGKLPGEKAYTCQCLNCKTLFKFKQSEAHYMSDQRDGDYLRIKCPLEGCGHSCSVSVSSKNSQWDR